jgi:hypothetical protein
MSMAVEPSAGVRFPPPFVYLGALLLGLAAERLVTLRWARCCSLPARR